MKSFSSALKVLVLLAGFVSTLTGVASARRSTPFTPNNPRSQFYLIDSDDDSPLAPSYAWIDTTFGTWVRITNFTNMDDGYGTVPSTVDSLLFPYYSTTRYILQPPHTVQTPMGTSYDSGCTISTNATIAWSGIFYSPQNQLLPIAGLSKNLVAPLWSDWEFRTAGDTTKVLVRKVKDSLIVSFYNLALKGTNGQVRATFQVLFKLNDTTITFSYKSFDGSFNGVPAAQLIQRVATIGLQSTDNTSGIMYLHKGTYYARSFSSAYMQNLHNGLSIRFLRMPLDAFEVWAVNMPTSNHYEMTTNVGYPSATFYNETDTVIQLFVRTTITNMTTGSTFYSRVDSVSLGGNGNTTFTTPAAFTGLGCGSYRVTMTGSYRNSVSDQWSGNNGYTRYFVLLSPQTPPFREEFTGTAPSACAWSNNGVTLADAQSVMYVADPTITGSQQAAIFDRYDVNGNPYTSATGGDTLTSAPINLSNQSKVYLMFHYQRGTKADSSEAGIYRRVLSGPESPIANAAGGMIQNGDTLFVEGLPSTGSTWNPASSSWVTLGAIPGGFDVTTQTFRLQLPNSMLHDHFRLRFRLKARDNESWQNLFEDADNFVVDEIHVEPFQANKTELEPLDVDLGAGNYTHVPRNISGGLQPKVRIMNNGDGVVLGLSVLHLMIKDALGRPVYDKTNAFSFPQPLTDSLFPMPLWDIRGSQGGVFTVKVALEQTYYDSYRSNDTNIFYKTLYIDDSYALDDGQPDTVGTQVNPSSNFYYDFTSLGNDTLRGTDFYYTGASVNSNWQLTITWGNNTASRNFVVYPTTPGFYRGTFQPFAMTAGTPYRLHYNMLTGSNLGGDASNGLVYFTTRDTTTPANSQYGELHPAVLNSFEYVANATDAAQGGTLLPMMRLVFSGSAQYLPVNLVSMKADRLASGEVAVTWRTAAEEQVYNFDVVRVADNAVAASVMAQNASTGANYAALDHAAPTTEVTYALIERDLDGSRRELGRVTAAAVGNQPITLCAYPNPASGRLTVTSSEKLDGLRILDPLGRTVLDVGGMDATAGLDVSALPSGSYFLEGTQNGRTIRMQISIVH